MKKEKFEGWGLPVEKMFLAAGPCSAESQEQILQSAEALMKLNIGFLRAGVWKPRTRPGCFEGVGGEGLAWLDHARCVTGIKVGTEVAEPSHVEACLEFGMDVLWIGARTTTNPFSVQAIADALKGVDIPVFIKNPMSADIGLWIGAFERLSNAGITKLGAIHRGFSSTLEMRYRNAPNWKIPIEFKRRLADVPILCDPSHICGNIELIPAIAQESMDLLFDGLMVEVHPNPPAALSDASQQLTPAQFKVMVDALKLQKEDSNSKTYAHQISGLREHIDDLDSQLMDLLGKRMDVVRQMGKLKADQQVSVLQPNRWEKMVQDRIKKGVNLNLSEDFILQLMQSVHEEAIRQQELIRGR